MQITWVCNIPLRTGRRLLDKQARGSGHWLDALRDQLGKYGHTINVITPNSPSKQHAAIHDEYGTHILMPRRAFLAPFSHQRLICTIAQEIIKTKPDIVDFHGTEYGYPEATRHVSVPCITTLQGILAHIVPNYFGPRGGAGFALDVFRARVEPKHIVQLLMARCSYRSRLGWESRAFRESKNFLGRTDFDRRWARELSPTHRSYHTAARILRPSFYTATAWKPTGGRIFTILKVGRFTPDKGNDTLIAALGRLVHVHGVDACVRLVGVDYPRSGWGKTVTRMAENHGVSDRLHFEGYLGAAEIAELALKSDAFALTSYSENSPNSLAEAMYLGMPCVSSDCGGASSMIRDRVDGLLYQPGDAAALSEALLSIVRDSSFAQRLGAGARSVSMVRHDPVTVAEATLSAYVDVIYSHRHIR